MPSSTNWLQIIVLYIAGTLAAFQYAKMPWMIKGLLIENAYSPFEQALLLSTTGILGAMAGAFAGALCQRVGMRHSLIMGLLIAIVGAALPLLSHAFTLLLLARMVESVAHVAIAITVPTLMLMLSAEKDRPRIMTVWSCYFTLTFMGVAAIAPMVNQFAGWQGFVLLNLLLLIVITLAIVIFIKENRPQKAPNSQPLRHLFGAQWRLLSQKRLLIIPLIFIGYTLLFVSLVNVFPSLLSSDAQMQYLWGFLLPSCALLGTIVSLVSLRRFKPWKLVRIAVFILIPASIALMWKSYAINIHSALALIIFFALGLLPAGIISSLPDLIASHDPDLPLVNGGLVQFGNLGNFIGPPILALLMTQWHWIGVGVYLFVGVALVGICLFVLVGELQRRELE